ncbi:MAG TPA: carboxypeptidase-like regulatory domain-containing protein, partial [Vicinamibacterales bacterium]|nr:carboxypeptidase-like regulatory domain-containing protein [Vicinamibacterales bacterium]
MIAALALAAIVSAPALTSAQVLYGSITGTVSDPQGAALPGVTVTAVNTGTGLKLEQVTDGTGDFTFRNMVPGVYDLSASLEGFKELRQTGVNVTAGNPIRMNLRLELGGITETVNVSA